MSRLPVTLLTLALSFSTSARAASPAFNYGTDKVRGVSIGGWLVLEPWITPSLFEATGNEDIVDEYTFGELQDEETASAALTQHWDTFITEQDFKDIAAAGLNHVRLPIGYWAFDVSENDPYLQGQLPYLQRAVAWADSAQLKVILDIHGAPGSQNGFDNSGQRLDEPTWHTKHRNVKRTEKVLEQLATMFSGNCSTATMITPLNEPAGFLGEEVLDVAADYHTAAYDIIRDAGKADPDSSVVVLIHDAFQNGSYWGDFLVDGTHDVAYDTHQYQAFTVDVLNLTQAEHIEAACNISDLLQLYELPVVVGEWSPAITDCTLYLNGRGIGARWDGTYPESTLNNSCSDNLSRDASLFSEEYKAYLRKYWEAQVTAYETSYGWVQWTWKTEPGTADEWSYQMGLKYGWIPQNPADPAQRIYPDVCSPTSVTPGEDGGQN